MGLSCSEGCAPWGIEQVFSQVSVEQAYEEGGSPSPSLNYPMWSGPSLDFLSNVVERLKEFISIWGPGDRVSQLAKASTCHSPPVWRIFLAASDYGVISWGLCCD